MFFADCSPKDNPEVIFTADINKNGDGIVADGYAQGVIKKEVDNLLKDDFNELFGDCYTRPYISNYYNVPEFLNAKDITIQEYISEVDADVICLSYSVYVDASQLSNDTVEQERDLSMISEREQTAIDMIIETGDWISGSVEEAATGQPEKALLHACEIGEKHLESIADYLKTGKVPEWYTGA